MFEIVGWAGGALLAICALPELVLTISRRRSTMPWALLVPWFAGEVLSLTYAISQAHYPLIVNYTVNIIALSIITYFRAHTDLGKVEYKENVIIGPWQNEKAQ